MRIFLHIFSKGTFSLIHGKKPFHCIHCTSSFRHTEGSLQKSTCQHIQRKGVSVVTSAAIHASRLMISRNTCCSILERSPLPAISVASLTGGQAGWYITWKKLFACNKCKYSFMQSPDLKKHICTRHQHQANDLFLWYWPCFVMILEERRAVKKNCLARPSKENMQDLFWKLLLWSGVIQI